jgi:predicted RNase H-like HicB family nuclease
MQDTRHIEVNYDTEAQVWWAESEDLPGLVSEAATLDELIDRVTAVAGELLSANGAAPGVVRLEFSTTREVQAA